MWSRRSITSTRNPSSFAARSATVRPKNPAPTTRRSASLGSTAVLSITLRGSRRPWERNRRRRVLYQLRRARAAQESTSSSGEHEVDPARREPAARADRGGTGALVEHERVPGRGRHQVERAVAVPVGAADETGAPAPPARRRQEHAAAEGPGSRPGVQPQTRARVERDDVGVAVAVPVADPG